jgi:hypothetical protein
MTPTDLILINQQLDALRQRDEDARKAIAAQCERIAILEEYSSLHHHAITHCTGGCRAELHKTTPFES